MLELKYVVARDWPMESDTVRPRVFSFLLLLVT